MQDPAPDARQVEEGVVEWLEIVDEALKGLHHALNNRIGSLSALVELHQLGDLPADGSGFENLAADQEFRGRPKGACIRIRMPEE